MKQGLSDFSGFITEKKNIGHCPNIFERNSITKCYTFREKS